MIVRRIRPEDGELLQDVRLRALETDPKAFGSSYEAEVTRTAEDWAMRASRGSKGADQFVCLAIHNGLAAGMAGGYQPEETPDTRVLYGMWVDPEVRSQGLGRSLVEAVVAWAGESGANTLTLWVVTINQPAIRLYRQAGFSETGATQPLPSDPSFDEVEMSMPLV